MGFIYTECCPKYTIQHYKEDGGGGGEGGEGVELKMMETLKISLGHHCMFVTPAKVTDKYLPYKISITH